MAGVKELFAIYPNKNRELRSVALMAYEFGMNVAEEPSAGATLGLDEHALNRVLGYVDRLKLAVEQLKGRPIPDEADLPDVQYPIDMSQSFQTILQERDGGQEVVLNEEAQILMEDFLALAVGLSRSNSAGVAGSLIKPDYERAVNRLSVIEQRVVEISQTPVPDLPATSAPGARKGRLSETAGVASEGVTPVTSYSGSETSNATRVARRPNT